MSGQARENDRVEIDEQDLGDAFDAAVDDEDAAGGLYGRNAVGERLEVEDEERSDDEDDHNGAAHDDVHEGDPQDAAQVSEQGARQHSSKKRPAMDADDLEDDDEEEGNEIGDDDGDEEDEEEDDNNDDEGSARGRKDRPRKRAKNVGTGVNAFLDVMAEVDDDDEEAEAEDEEELAGGFIEEEDGTMSPGATRDDRRHRQLDANRERMSEEDARRIARELDERFKPSMSRSYEGATGNLIPRRMLLPDVRDPSIWAARCKPGKEKDIIFNLLRKVADLELTPKKLDIISAFQRDSLQGYIYIEARKAVHVQAALADIVNVYASKLILVPIAEMTDLFRVKQSTTELIPGSYVRIKNRNKRYAGDLGQIDNILEAGDMARVKLVPRIDYSVEVTGKKNPNPGLGSIANRPLARLFSLSELEKASQDVHGAKRAEKRSDILYQWNGEEYEDGYLLKEFKLRDLVTDGVNPTLEELHSFTQGGNDALDLTSLAAGIKARSTVHFKVGDNIEVFEGEQAGVVGIVDSIASGVVEVRTASDSEMRGQLISVPVSGLRKRFKQGDHVKVQAGNFKDETGMVVQVDGDSVTLISDMSMKELQVRSKDLTEASETTGGAINTSGYEIHDLVQLDTVTSAIVIQVEQKLLRVMTQTGDVKLIASQAVTMKLDSKNTTATDRNGNEIRVGDTVKEPEGERRTGLILHIYRGFAFLHTRESHENNGIWAQRTRTLVIREAKGARIAPSLDKMNPATMNHQGMAAPALPRTLGRDKAVGQTVHIRQGPHKGLIGIVKDSTDQIARIELHTNNRTITIDKTKLGFKSPNGLLGYTEFINSKLGMGRGGPGSGGFNPRATMSVFDRPTTNIPAWAQSGGRTPIPGQYDGSRTPAWAQNAQSGSRTPAWAQSAGGHNSGSRTPAWAASGSRTPAYGSRTPAHGSATPAWNADSKTPGWSGNATPAWNTGNRTPAYGMAAGNATPAWGASKTPTWAGQDYAATPAVDYAATPGNWYEGTADVRNDAQTPGVPPISGRWDSAETPGYMPPSP